MMNRYRADIDGLRAIAIMSVLFFHVGFSAFSGGYVGVDIFFVISGFLITRLIKEDLSQNHSFNFTRFYTKRARRLFPALFFTLAVCSFFAYYLFSPQLLERFSAALMSTVGSVSNIYFWTESGYFDANSHLKPLLHTWSLSVEEQFYFIWPFLLVFLLVKLPKLFVPLTILFIGLVSLVLNEVFIVEKSAIFFLTPFRIFEFSIGALVVWLVQYQPKSNTVLEVVFAIGLVMVLIPVFYFTKATEFPSINALLPVVGAALLIYAGTAKFGGKILNNPVAVGLGLISYSLYLVHWPIIVFYEYYKFDKLAVIEQWLIIAVSLIIAYFMYRFIEQPFRYKRTLVKGVSATKVALIYISLSLLIAVFAGFIWVNNGLPSRLQSPESPVLKKQLMQDQKFFDNYVLQAGTYRNKFSDDLGDSHKLKVLIIGDSQGKDFINIVTSSNISKKLNLAFERTRSFCQSIYGVDFKKIKKHIPKSRLEKCQKYQSSLNSSTAVHEANVIVFAGSWNYWGAYALAEAVKNVRAVNALAKIVVIGPKTQGVNGIEFANRFHMLSQEERLKKYRALSSNNYRLIENKLKETPLIDSYISMYDILCGENERNLCMVLEPNGGMIMYDNNHLTPNGARFFYDALSKRGVWDEFFLK